MTQVFKRSTGTHRTPRIRYHALKMLRMRKNRAAISAIGKLKMNKIPNTMARPMELIRPGMMQTVVLPLA